MKQRKTKQEKPRCPSGWKAVKKNGGWVCVPNETGGSGKNVNNTGNPLDGPNQGGWPSQGAPPSSGSSGNGGSDPSSTIK